MTAKAANECSRTRLEFKEGISMKVQFLILKCSRTRLEFKAGVRRRYGCGPDCNAVAPDWNLKYALTSYVDGKVANAVAPDWNLK